MAEALTPLERALARLAADLRAVGARWALVGGLGVSARAEPRLTRDVDVAVAVADDDEAEGLVRALMDLGYGVASVLEHDPTGRLATVRLLVPEAVPGGIVADLLFSTAGVEPRIVDGASSVRLLPALTVPVASIGSLIALKLLSESERRPRDAQDLLSLLGVAGPADLEEAGGLVDTMREGGFHRGKDLQERLRHYRELAGV